MSPKTIRDIWNRRAWSSETRFLWGADDEPQLRPKSTKSSGLANDAIQDQQLSVCLKKHPDCQPNPCDDKLSSGHIQVFQVQAARPAYLRDTADAEKTCSMDTWLLLRELSIRAKKMARANDFEILSSVPELFDDPIHFDWSHW